MNKKQLLIAVCLIVIGAGSAKTYYSNKSPAAVTTFSMPVNKKVIVLDSGHGGWDPGMVGADGTREKDINLLITEKLQSYLELGGSVVLVTREADEALGGTKRQDLSERRNIADEAELLVSIHQNSFSDQSVRGAQAFYYNGSEESKLLAECIQEQINTYLCKDNKFIAKANNNYYLLKKTDVTSVIVECGFLSNPDERRLLSEEEYQEKIAWAVYMGIVQYFALND